MRNSYTLEDVAANLLRKLARRTFAYTDGSTDLSTIGRAKFGERLIDCLGSSTPNLISGTGWEALWMGADFAAAREDFWKRYSQLLSLIAQSVDKNGAPNFESNTVTRLYEELIQAARGTRWVWAMTCASSIEALINLLGPPGRAHTDASEQDALALIEHIKGWQGDAVLKQSAINAIKRTLKTTAATELRRLVSIGAISKSQQRTWEDIRHHVMHGGLISPYSTGQEEQDRLMDLAGMMRALTLEVLRQSLPT